MKREEKFLHLFYLRFIKFLEQKSGGKKSLMRPVRHNKAIAQSYSQSSNARLWPQIYAIQLKSPGYTRYANGLHRGSFRMLEAQL